MPPGLGPLQVDLGIQGAGLSAQFWAHNHSDAAAIASRLGELRGALAASGMALGHAGVGLGFGRPGRDAADGTATGRTGYGRPRSVLAVAGSGGTGVRWAARGRLDILA